MRFQFVTHDGYHEVRLCPHCDSEIKLLSGQDVVTCEECNKTWSISFDYSFDGGRWRDCTNVSEVTNVDA